MMIDILRRTNKQHIDHGTLPNTRARTQKLSFNLALLVKSIVPPSYVWYRTTIP